jgi:hypothetical protein
LEGWRKDPDHPLKWERVLGRITYRPWVRPRCAKGHKISNGRA